MDEFWGQVKTVFGGANVDIHLGGDSPASLDATLGERRVISWTAIGAALVVGYLIGRR